MFFCVFISNKLPHFTGAFVGRYWHDKTNKKMNLRYSHVCIVIFLYSNSDVPVVNPAPQFVRKCKGTWQNKLCFYFYFLNWTEHGIFPCSHCSHTLLQLLSVYWLCAAVLLLQMRELEYYLTAGRVRLLKWAMWLRLPLKVFSLHRCLLGIFCWQKI